MSHEAETTYPVHELIRRRWSPRAFSSRPIESATLGSLLEAARWAPSSYNEQPWLFITARNQDRDDFNRALDCVVPGNRAWVRHAPLLLFALAHSFFRHNGKRNRHAFHDVGLAVAQLTLQATALGLGVHQMAGIEAECIRKSYSVPEEWEPVTGIAIGYPGDPEMLPEKLRQVEVGGRMRKPLEKMVYGGNWNDLEVGKT